MRFHLVGWGLLAGLLLAGCLGNDENLRLGPNADVEFRLAQSEPDEGYAQMEMRNSDEVLYVGKEVLMDAQGLKAVRSDLDSFGRPQITLIMNAEGTKRFGEITAEHVGERLAIISGGEILTAPNINEPIRGGQASISGPYTAEEVEVLTRQILGE